MMTPTLLLTNDDGPPHTKGYLKLNTSLPSLLSFVAESPYVLGLYLKLKALGWNVKVVLPSSQKSWIGPSPLPATLRRVLNVIQARPTTSKRLQPAGITIPRRMALEKQAPNLVL
jgi:broad specificity polyphosphatase/5'/3'-nucleotidase SurE